MDQPFSTQTIARTPHFADREGEVKRVLEAMRTRGRLVLYGERRMGKSSVIARAAERIEAGGGVEELYQRSDPFFQAWVLRSA